MTEEGAAHYLAALDVSRGTLERLAILVAAVLADDTQNLVASSTKAQIWARHVVDSMQLLPLAPAGGDWIDIGSGAGLPGLAVAATGDRAVTLVEPRRRRAEFLIGTASQMGLRRVTVIAKRAEDVPPRRFAVISARAVAPLDRLFPAAQHLAGPETIWLLPKGANARAELAEAERSWQGDFRLVPSVTDSAAAIVVARSVERRKQR